MTFFPIHWKPFPGSARNHHKLCTSLVLGTGFAAAEGFCPICSQESLYCYFHGWLKCLCSQGGRGEAGGRASPDLEHCWRWDTALKVILSQQAAQSLLWWEFHGSDRNASGGERNMTGGVPGRCCFLWWMEACPRVATNTGHSSDPNYCPDAGLKSKGTPSAIRNHDSPLPTHVSTWEENWEFFLFQENVCSNYVPFLTKHWLAPNKKVIPF